MASTVNSLNILPLDKVIIGAKTTAAFEKVEHASFRDSLLFSIYNNTIIVQRGCSVDLELIGNQSCFKDLVVLECLPVFKGYLTSATSIIFVDLTKDSISESSQIYELGNPRIESVRDKFNYGFPVKIDYRCHSLLYKHIKNVDESFSGDETNCIFLNKELIHELGLSEFCLVTIAALENNLEGATLEESDLYSKRTVALKAVDWEDGNSSHVHIPYILWFNIMQPVSLQKNVKIKFLVNNKTEANELCSPLTPSVVLPKVDEVHIKHVYNPALIDQSLNFDEELAIYFSRTRILSEGDIIAIDIEEKMNAYQERRDEFTTPSCTTFYKVIKLLPKNGDFKTYTAHIDYTSLYQAGIINCYAPTIIHRNWPNNSIPEFLIKAPGLHDYIDNLARIIVPYVNPKNSHCGLVASVLVTGASACGKTTIAKAVAHQFGMHIIKGNCFELLGDTSAATEARIKHVFTNGLTYAPCIFIMKNVHVIGNDREGRAEDHRVANSFQKLIKEMKSDSFPVIIVATTTKPHQLHPDVMNSFIHDINIESPSQINRKRMIVSLLESDDLSSDVDLEYLSQRTAGMVAGDIEALVVATRRQAFFRLREYIKRSGKANVSSLDLEEELCNAGFCLVMQDFQEALDKMQVAHSKAIGAPKVPNVTWEDVGGLISVKSEILDTIQLPLQHPELFAAGLRRSGVLLYGPPGTGKTLLAKAVATECSLNFLSVKGPELINMYIGQSEQNVREVFQKARSASPCVIFFDELDSLAPNRGRSGDSGGVMDRVVSQMLAELDGLHKSNDVFVIGATNRPDLIDAALLRPGRFDKLLFIGISEDAESKLNILQALTRKFNLAASCNLKTVAENCPPNMTGADLYALCSDATLNAIRKKIELLENGDYVDQSILIIEETDFNEALKTLHPSVSIEEIRNYEFLKDKLQTV